jgi:hypothetical protein
MRIQAFALSALLISGCGPVPPEETPVQSSAAVMLEIRPGTPLDSMLYRLDALLAGALAGRMEGEAVIDFRRAEALSDRLLEANLPFEWIPGEQYSLQSRLRQIQSAADRILAQLDTGAPREPMLEELRALRNDVISLRATVAEGGTRAPPPIERLLRFGDTASVPPATAGTGPAPAAAPQGPRPIGTPIPDGDTPGGP